MISRDLMRELRGTLEPLKILSTFPYPENLISTQLKELPVRFMREFYVRKMINHGKIDYLAMQMLSHESI